MVLFNHSTRELTAKIVYYGPGLCGKTTNLRVLHDRLERGTTGRLLSLATAQDRTIYFDLLPVELGNVKGYTVRFQLCTVPGQVFYNETRKLVLRGVDGIVMVVDSQASMLSQDLESFQNLRDNLREGGIVFEDVPLVVQYNKRDLPGVLDIAALSDSLALGSYPWVEAVASQGRGVVETFKLISKLTFVTLLKKLQKTIGADPESWSLDRLATGPGTDRPEETTVQVSGAWRSLTAERGPRDATAAPELARSSQPAVPGPVPVPEPAPSRTGESGPTSGAERAPLPGPERGAVPVLVAEPASTPAPDPPVVDEIAPFAMALEPPGVPAPTGAAPVSLAALDELTRRLSDLERRVASQDRVDELEASLKGLLASAEEAFEKALEKYRAETVEARKLLVEETARLSDQQDRHEEVATSLRSELDALPAQVEELRSALGASATRDQVGADLVLLKDELSTELRAALGTALETLRGEHAREREEAEATVARLRQDAEAFRNGLEGLRATMAPLSDLPAAVESTREAGTAAANAARNELMSSLVLVKDELSDELRRTLDDLRAEHARERAASEDGLARLHEEILQLRTGLAIAGRRNARLFEGLRRAISTLDTEEGHGEEEG